RVLPSSPCRADAAGLGHAPARPRQRCRVRRSAATRVADRPAAIADEHAAPQADRDPGFDRRGEPCGPALGRDLERLVYWARSEEHTSELQSPYDLVCRLLLEKKKP